MNPENVLRGSKTTNDLKSFKDDDYRFTLPRLVFGNEKRCLLTHRDGLLIYLPSIHRRSSYPYQSKKKRRVGKRSLEPSKLEKRHESVISEYNNINGGRRKRRRRRRRRKKKRKDVSFKRRVSQKLPPIQPSLNPFQPPYSPDVGEPSPDCGGGVSRKKKKKKKRKKKKENNLNSCQRPFRPLLKKRRRNIPRVKVTCRADHGIDCLNRKRINEYSLIDSKKSIFINHRSSNQLFHVDSFNKFQSPQRYDEVRYELKILRDHIRFLHPNIFSFTECIDDFSDDNVYLVYPSNKIFFPSAEIFSQFSPSKKKRQQHNNKKKNKKRNEEERLMTLERVLFMYQLDFRMIDRLSKQVITLLNFLFQRNLVIADITPEKDFLVDIEEGNILLRGVVNLQYMDPETYDEFDIRNCEVNMINIIGETLFYMCFVETVRYDDFGKILFFGETQEENEQQQQQHDNNNDKKYKYHRRKTIYESLPEHLLELIMKTCTDEPVLGLESLEELFAKTRSRQRKREKKRKEMEKKKLLREEVCKLEEIIQRIDVVFRSRK